jgi:Cd2+/Zn2+-exporting ATPase/Cu+-exporting ATPase
VRRNGDLTEVPIEQLREADRVMVLPGGRIPVDGLVLGGESFVDESSITGEPRPVAKGEGSRVLAGTINQTGALDIQSERVGRDTSFGRIMDAVERAEHRRAPIQRIADRLAGYLVYVALAAAAVTWLVTRDTRATISVILVAGACGVAAGTPLAILGAIGRAARNGVIIKGGIHLEALWGIDTVVLDKTGTVTFWDARVRAASIRPPVSVRQLLEAAAIAECRSDIRSAVRIIEHASNSGIVVSEPSGPQSTCRVQGVSAYGDGRFWWVRAISSRLVGCEARWRDEAGHGLCHRAAASISGGIAVADAAPRASAPVRT